MYTAALHLLCSSFRWRQGRNEKGQGEHNLPGLNHYRGAKSPRGASKGTNSVTGTFLNTVHLLPKDFRFEHGGAKLASCPGRHLTSLRPWVEVVGLPWVAIMRGVIKVENY